MPWILAVCLLLLLPYGSAAVDHTVTLTDDEQAGLLYLTELTNKGKATGTADLTPAQCLAQLVRDDIQRSVRALDTALLPTIPLLKRLTPGEQNRAIAGETSPVVQQRLRALLAR